MSKPEHWWEYLDWNKMKNTWDRMPEETKNKIREAGLAPEYDSEFKEKEENEC